MPSGAPAGKSSEVFMIMGVSTEAPESKFAFVVIAGHRSRQLMLGARTRLAYPRSQKPTRIAI